MVKPARPADYIGSGWSRVPVLLTGGPGIVPYNGFVRQTHTDDTLPYEKYNYIRDPSARPPAAEITFRTGWSTFGSSFLDSHGMPTACP